MRLDENENIQVLDEDDIRAILAVQGMENEFCDVLSCAVTIGRLVNCNKVILGSISQSNGTYIMNSYVVNVSNEMIDYHHNIESQNTELLEAAVQPLASSISHKIENELRGTTQLNNTESEVIRIDNENSTLQITTN